MSFTRNLLKGLGLTDEQQTAVIEAHQAEMSAVKAERDRFQTEAETSKENLASVQKQLDALKQANTDADGWKAKAEQAVKELADYRAEQEAKAARTAKESALNEILRDNFTEAGAAKILKYTDLSSVELDDGGKVKGKAALVKSLREEWPEFIQTTETKGADIPTPPTGTAPAAGKTAAEILAIRDDAEMVRAIEENPAAFGLA